MVGIVGAAIGVVGIWYAARAFALKAGLRILGSFSVSSSIDCDDRYVRHVTLFNAKDRAVAVFKIFLRLDHGVFLEVDDFEGEPLILEPFAAWHREYDPIEMYSFSMRRVNLDALLKREYRKSRLVLATTDGMYVVRKWLKSWDPIYTFFKNNATIVAHPLRMRFEGKAYGSNTRFIVELNLSNGRREVIPINASDHRFQKFRKFRLPESSLNSRQALEEFLIEQAASGVLPCDNLTVHDWDEWRAENYEDMRGNTVHIVPRSWFGYHVLGRIGTRLRDAKRQRRNRVHVRTLKRRE
jgi:hypothetical protein